MKISHLGINQQQGKVKYNDETLIKLTEKVSPQKTSPFFAEFVGEDFAGSDCIIITKDKLLDLLIMDIEKVETRIHNTADETEKQILQKMQEHLEKEIPVCDIEFNAAELLQVRALGPLSLKPTLIVESPMPTSDLIKKALEKAGVMFFYTVGPKEVKAWLVKKNASVIECAAKIHSDLARGFIKAEVVKSDDFLSVHNMQEARSKGYEALVDRDYIVQSRDILTIRFSV